MTDTTRLATAIADRYTIERELGQGGMATVYLAYDIRHDRKVALKVLRPELAVVATPGSLIARPLVDGRNPGAGHLRFALVPSEADVAEAAARLTGTKWLES